MTRNIYDQWVFDTFGVDPSLYPLAPPALPAAPAPPAPPGHVDPDGDPAKRQAEANKLTRVSKNATAAELTLVANHVASTMPLSELKTLDAAGTTFLVTRGDVTTALPTTASMRPRAYVGASPTFRGVPGLFWPPTNQVVVATQAGPAGGRVLSGKTQSSSADIVLHEAGHAISRTPFWSNLADTDKFKAAYATPMTGSLSKPYFHQANIAAGRDEAFAESHAMYLITPATLRAESPALDTYWQERLAH